MLSLQVIERRLFGLDPSSNGPESPGRNVSRAKSAHVVAEAEADTRPVQLAPPPSDFGSSSPSSAVPETQEWVGRDTGRGTEFEKSIDALLARVQGQPSEPQAFVMACLLIAPQPQAHILLLAAACDAHVQNARDLSIHLTRASGPCSCRRPVHLWRSLRTRAHPQQQGRCGGWKYREGQRLVRKMQTACIYVAAEEQGPRQPLRASAVPAASGIAKFPRPFVNPQALNDADSVAIAAAGLGWYWRGSPRGMDWKWRVT